MSGFAEAFNVYYKWPDEDEWREGIVVHTDVENHELAARCCGLTDDQVLIYTEHLTPQYIKENFDGLEIKLLRC